METDSNRDQCDWAKMLWFSQNPKPDGVLDSYRKHIWRKSDQIQLSCQLSLGIRRNLVSFFGMTINEFKSIDIYSNLQRLFLTQYLTWQSPLIRTDKTLIFSSATFLEGSVSHHRAMNHISHCSMMEDGSHLKRYPDNHQRVICHDKRLLSCLIATILQFYTVSLAFQSSIL